MDASEARQIGKLIRAAQAFVESEELDPLLLEAFTAEEFLVWAERDILGCGGVLYGAAFGAAVFERDARALGKRFSPEVAGRLRETRRRLRWATTWEPTLNHIRMARHGGPTGHYFDLFRGTVRGLAGLDDDGD